MAFGPPAAQPVVFAQLVLHLLSAKVEGGSCHLVHCSLPILLCTDALLEVIHPVLVGLIIAYGAFT